MFHSRHQIEGSQGSRILCNHLEDCEKGSIPSYVNKTSYCSEITRRYIGLT
jgi:hypothetical protein